MITHAALTQSSRSSNVDLLSEKPFDHKCAVVVISVITNRAFVEGALLRSIINVLSSHISLVITCQIRFAEDLPANYY